MDNSTSVLDTGFIDPSDEPVTPGSNRISAESWPRLRCGQVFESYDDFNCELQKYTSYVKIPFVKKKSQTVAGYNRKLTDERNHLPDHLQYQHVEITCKHFGHHSAKGTGARDTQ